jgi:hypothetical protein
MRLKHKKGLDKTIVTVMIGITIISIVKLNSQRHSSAISVTFALVLSIRSAGKPARHIYSNKAGVVEQKM